MYHIKPMCYARHEYILMLTNQFDIAHHDLFLTRKMKIGTNTSRQKLVVVESSAQLAAKACFKGKRFDIYCYRLK